MADRVEQRARLAREHVGVRWDVAQVEVLLRRTKARARRRTVYRLALAAAAVALAIGTAVAWPRGELVAAPVVRAPAPPRSADNVIHLADGSTVTLLTSQSDVVVARVNEDEIRLRLVRGAARFDVVPGLRRTFRVTAGEVEISVLGTVFEVWREAAGARVHVLEGRVRVTWPPDREAFLERGDSGAFPMPEPRASNSEPIARIASAATSTRPPVAAPAEPPAISALAEPPAPAVARARPARRPRRRTPNEVMRAWMELAEDGDYEEAARILASDERALEGASLEALLLASDTMRLTHRPARALEYLDRAAEMAEGDARAPLVAFTRGRLLLTALSRPYEAAEAFARARSLAPNGSLAMDALAREIEALARAGDTEAARARAEEYLARYPNGLRVAAVRRWGGIDP